jgi:archaellum component FlaC
MDERIERIENKLNKIDHTLTKIEVTLAVNTKSLEEHMRRSDALEKMIDRVETDLSPVKKHVSNLQFIGRALPWLVGLLIGLGTILKFKK